LRTSLTTNRPCTPTTWIVLPTVPSRSRQAGRPNGLAKVVVTVGGRWRRYCSSQIGMRAGRRINHWPEGGRYDISPTTPSKQSAPSPEGGSAATLATQANQSPMMTSSQNGIAARMTYRIPRAGRRSSSSMSGSVAEVECRAGNPATNFGGDRVEALEDKWRSYFGMPYRANSVLTTGC
jgi:hypothetical protein